MTVLDKSTVHAASAPRDTARSPIVWLTLLPIILATLVSIGASLWSIGFRLTMSWSQNPWESAIVADAWRFARGLATGYIAMRKWIGVDSHR